MTWYKCSYQVHKNYAITACTYYTYCNSQLRLVWKLPQSDTSCTNVVNIILTLHDLHISLNLDYYCVTNSINQGPSWKANSHSICQETCTFYGAKVPINILCPEPDETSSHPPALLTEHPWILSSRLFLGSGLFPSRFPIIILCSFIISPKHTMYALTY